MRAFLALRTGTGTKADPFRPACTLTGLQWASWDIEHPDTDAFLGYMVVADTPTAPIDCLADLGDPTDKASMRSVSIDNVAADAIATLAGVNRNRVRGLTGFQVIRFLNKSQPIMQASWGSTIAALTDT